MKSLFAKIMLAQVTAVVLALAVVMMITRLSLDRGFMNFLERQESGILHHLAPALADVYLAQGGWEFLRESPDNWQRILRRSRQLGGQPPSDRLRNRKTDPGPGRRLDPDRKQGFEPSPGDRLRWLRTFDRLALRERLFVLDENREPLAGLHGGHGDHQGNGPELKPIVVDGTTVGWVGFAPARRDRPPEVMRFLQGQVKAHILALVVALALVTILAYALARHLSRPVAQLDRTVNQLSRGQFSRRASVASRDEIGRLARNVNALAETLEKNRAARHRWMTDIAHELRTPVAILKGEIEALGDGVRAPDARAFTSLAEEINHLSKLVDDLQSLSLADAGALSLDRETVDLAELIGQSADAFYDQFARRGIELEVATSGPVTVNADPRRIRQLLNNLLENCVRYVVDRGRVKISLSGDTEGAAILVEDSGPGIGAGPPERLFERFYRAEPGRSRSGGGSGLGLSICKSIAEAHGGSIRAEQTPMGGLGIRVNLPY